MARIDDIEVFIDIYEQNSLTLAARKSRLPVTTVSRKLQDLEHRLGAALINRTTRTLSPTDLGREFYEKVAPAYAAIRDAECEMRGHVREPSGTIRLMTPYAFGLGPMRNWIRAFSELYPAVNFVVLFDNTNRDPAELGVDISVAVGDVPDSSLTMLKLFDVGFCLVASPDYLARHEAPHLPSDLAAHRIYGVAMQTPARPWVMTCGGEQVEVAPAYALVTNEPTLIIEAALRGDGIARLPEWTIQDQLARGDLLRVLPDWIMARRITVSLLFAKRIAIDTKMRLFIDFVAKNAQCLASRSVIITSP